MRNSFDHGAATALRNLTVTAALQEASSRRWSSGSQSTGRGCCSVVQLLLRLMSFPNVCR